MTEKNKIKHLFNRAAFGIAPEKWPTLSSSNIQKEVKRLFEQKIPDSLAIPHLEIPSKDEIKKMDKIKKAAFQKELRKLTISVNTEWLAQMIISESSFHEKMALFWHGHFACEPKQFHLAARYADILRKNALGKFRDLLLAVSKDAAMILYLNNQQNRKNAPNENYSRELMELFTIGRGNYTENDVKEAARAFTGWFCDRISGEFTFKKQAHDEGIKKFMGESGNFNGEDIIDIILQRKETAYFIAKKVYRYFVSEIHQDENQIKELANVLYDSDYDIAKMMKYLFLSDWFYEDRYTGAKIKSPVELLVGMAKTLSLKADNKETWIFPQRALGQILFRPPNVAGWPAAKAWIDNSTLLLRLNFAALVFDRSDIAFRLKEVPENEKRKMMKKLEISADLAEMQKVFNNGNEKNLKKELSEFLLPLSLEDRFEKFDVYADAAKTTEDKLRAWTLVFMSLPEYQLC